MSKLNLIIRQLTSPPNPDAGTWFVLFGLALFALIATFLFIFF